MAAQVAAETLGLPYENIIVDTADTDTGPHCMGTFASRGTHRVGNAVIMAAQEAREAMLDAAAEELEVDAEDLETDGTGFIKLKGSDEKKIHVVDLALAAHFKLGRTIAGPRHLPQGALLSRCPRRARWTRTPARRTPARWPTSRSTTRPAWSRSLALHNVYEVGRAINPAMAKQQIEGGAWMGISHALFETTEPYYPDRDHGPRRLRGVPDARAGRQRR